ncbi:MAG: PAS domain S-box protein [Dehalococcoidia bacterium]|nr:PAS domain S-box protein [Dehalococcoidia bacterium]
MFTAIAEPLRKLIPYDRFVATTWDPGTGMWTTRYVAGDAIEGHRLGESRIDHTPVAQQMIAEMRSTISIEDQETYTATETTPPGADRLRSAVRVPLIVNGELVGTIAARSRARNAYETRHLELAQRIADQIAGSVANSELHRALSDTEARTRAVVETAAVGIVTADSELTIDTVNDAVLHIFGYTREELIGENVMMLATEPYRSGHSAYLNRYEETGVAQVIGKYREVQGRRKDGTEFPMELEVAEVNLEQGKMYTAIIRDITDRKLAEQDLAELNENLEQRVVDRTAELEAFFYSVSHDLRGPLAMNAHLAERLLQSDQDTLSETAQKYIELIARSSQESAELVTDLLNFSRLGKQEMTIQRAEPTDIVKSIQTELQELNPGAMWTVGDLPSCQADPGLLRQVYTNLMRNACKFTKPGQEPRVEIGTADFEGDCAYFVRDEGIGFDMAEAEKVFDVFERLHRPEDYPGTGAGLAIVRRIIDRHGGRVWAESAVGEGSTFFFTLPRPDEDVPSSQGG